jgi:2-(1,2-epoxy-1,2-dihydrophenyl)acetyl-CoA isomerase
MSTVSYVVADGVAHIELDRPEVSNAVDLATAQALGEAVRMAGADSGVGAVLLTGAGKRFCAGGDVGSMVVAEDRAAHLLELAESLDGALQALAALPKPVVGAVQGAVAGAGIGVMLSCDVVVAEMSTKLVFAYPGIGLTPDCGVSWLLPRAVGQQRALELALTGRVLSGQELRDWGLVTEIVETDARQHAREVAAAMAAGPAHALGEARRLIRGSWERTRAEAGAEESRTIAAAVDTPYAERALEAYAEN